MRVVLSQSNANCPARQLIQGEGHFRSPLSLVAILTRGENLVSLRESLWRARAYTVARQRQIESQFIVRQAAVNSKTVVCPACR